MELYAFSLALGGAGLGVMGAIGGLRQLLSAPGGAGRAAGAAPLGAARGAPGGTPGYQQPVMRPPAALRGGSDSSSDETPGGGR